MPSRRWRCSPASTPRRWRFTDIANLRVKECDRINVLSGGSSRIWLGLAMKVGVDLLVASDPSLAGQTLPSMIETYADHRVAMSFALAGLKIGGIPIPRPLPRGRNLPRILALAAFGVRIGTQFA